MDYNKSAEYLKQYLLPETKIAIVVGSGLSGITEKITDKVQIPYSDIPEFLVSTAPTHKGEVVIGKLFQQPVICMNGRFHYYEGYGINEVAEYVKVLKLLGIQTLILSNASGSMRTELIPGSLVVVEDHINLTGLNPLRGKNDDSFGPRFVDMSNAYSKELIDKALECKVIGLQSGYYVFTTGPSFETAAEIRAYRKLGGDIVGMSTVPEVIMAAYCGLQTLVISCVSNYATGMDGSNVSDEELERVTALSKDKFASLLEQLFQKL